MVDETTKKQAREETCKHDPQGKHQTSGWKEHCQSLAYSSLFPWPSPSSIFICRPMNGKKGVARHILSGRIRCSRHSTTMSRRLMGMITPIRLPCAPKSRTTTYQGCRNYVGYDCSSMKRIHDCNAHASIKASLYWTYAQWL